MEVLILLGVIAVVAAVVIVVRRADSDNPKATGSVQGGGGSRSVNTQKK